MSDYQKQAEDFCKETNTKLRISFKEYGKHFDDDKENRNVYRVRIDRDGKTFSFNFGDSIDNTRKGKRPTKYDVLACLTKYEVEPDVWDFAKEFGYEISSKEEYKKVERTHKAVLNEYRNVERLFGDVMEQLNEIS